MCASCADLQGKKNTRHDIIVEHSRWVSLLWRSKLLLLLPPAWFLILVQKYYFVEPLRTIIVIVAITFKPLTPSTPLPPRPLSTSQILLVRLHSYLCSSTSSIFNISNRNTCIVIFVLPNIVAGQEDHQVLSGWSAPLTRSTISPSQTGAIPQYHHPTIPPQYRPINPNHNITNSAISSGCPISIRTMHTWMK